MTHAPGPRERPAPTPEEAAAIVAALGALRGEETGTHGRPASRWELSGRLGRTLSPGIKFEGSPWNHVRWEGKS